MDKKTELLVSLGASVAANCMPCFNYYYQQAEKLGLESAEVLRIMEIAYKIKNSLSMLMGNHSPLNRESVLAVSGKRTPFRRHIPGGSKKHKKYLTMDLLNCII